jgi:hypothetical protein
MPTFQQDKRIQRVEWVVILFFVIVALSVTVVYIVEPSIYTSTLKLPSEAQDRYPLLATVFLFVILVFIAILMVGTVRHWRWLFWVLLLAFSFSILEIPATLLQLAGFLPVFPGPFPLWYSCYRMGIALMEGGMAVWMFHIYRQYGVWGLRDMDKQARTETDARNGTSS